MREGRLALWGGAALDNVGDRVLFDVVQAELGRRLPWLSFARFCPWRERFGARPLWVGPTGDWPGRGEFSAVVVLGGVFGGPPFLNVLLQAFTLGANPGAFDPAARVAWHAVGLEDRTPPASQPLWQDYLRAVATRIDWLTVRAPNAAGRFAAAGARTPDIVADPVFALPPLDDPRLSRPLRRARPRIGVAIGDVNVSRRLAGSMMDSGALLKYIYRSGFDPAMCLGLEEIACYELDDRELEWKSGFREHLVNELAVLRGEADLEFLAIGNMYDDDQATKRFAASVPGATIRELSSPSADELTGAFGDYDLVIASRLHSIVLALRAGTRVVAADPYWTVRAGTTKVWQLLEQMGLSHRHWTYRPDIAARPLSDVAGDALAEESGDGERYRRMRRRALDEFDALAAFIADAKQPVRSDGA